MSLSAKDLFLLSQCAISAACQAGHMITNFSRHKLKVENKVYGSSLASQVVTEVDYLSQDIILKVLRPTCDIFDLALLTEERKDDGSRLEKDYFWCVDPLDGTLPYVEAAPGYAVSIALVSRSGVSQIGVIYDPVRQTLYHAIKGHGVFRNGKPWESPSSSIKPVEALNLICDRSFVQQPQFSVILGGLNRIITELGYSGLNPITHGAAAMNACWVLEKSPAVYFKFPKSQNGGGSLWDYSASACLFSEMNAVVTDIHGQPLDLNRPDSTYLNHRGILYATHREIAERISLLYQQISETN